MSIPALPARDPLMSGAAQGGCHIPRTTQAKSPKSAVGDLASLLTCKGYPQNLPSHEVTNKMSKENKQQSKTISIQTTN